MHLKYLILILMGAFIALLIWLAKKNVLKTGVAFQKQFVLNPDEEVLSEWPVYIPPQERQTEGKVLDFFEGGKLFKLVRTNQKRLAVIDPSQTCFVFDSVYKPHFQETTKNPNLHLFARVARAKVLDVTLPKGGGQMEWHVPIEVAQDLVHP